MTCGVCHLEICSCGPKTLFVPQKRKVVRTETIMQQKLVDIPQQVKVVEEVPCTARYERVSDSCSAKSDCAPQPAAHHHSPVHMDCGDWGGMSEWLFPWLYWVLPAIILVSGALGSLGSNDWVTGPWTLDNPLRYADWAFWTFLVLGSVFYGIMWGSLYSWGTTRDREPYLSFLISIPLWLGLAYIIVLYGADMPKEAAWVGYAMNGALIGVLALVAGVSPYPEISFLIAPLLAWGLYESDLVQQEAIARG